MADKDKRKGTGKSNKPDMILLEQSLKANWRPKDVENLKIFEGQPMKATDKSPMVKCILRNISTIREWQEAFSEKEVLKQECEKLKKQIASQKNETQQLRQAQPNTHTQIPPSNPADDLHKQLEKKQMEISKLNGQVSEINNAKKVLEKKLKDMESKWSEAKQERDCIGQELSSLQNNSDKLEMKKENEELRRQVSELDKLKEKLPLDKVLTDVQSPSPRNVEHIKLSEVNDDLKQKDQELKKALERASKLEEQLKTSDEEKQQVKKKLEKELKDKIETKENVVAGLEKDKTLLNEKVAALENQMAELEKKLDTETVAANPRKEEKQQLKTAESRIAALENHKKQLTEQIAAQKAGKEVEFLRHQVGDLTERLATEMNSKLSADESALENISIGNRPMKLAEDYQHFCSNIWLEVKEALDGISTFEQQDAIVLLQQVLMVSQERCTEAAKGVNIVLMQVLHGPVRGTFTVKQGKEMTPVIPEPARAIFNTIGDYLRRTADNVDLSSICEDVAQGVAKRSKDLKKNILENYIAESVRLSWKMAIQRPAMMFSVEGETKKWEGEKTQELYWGSNPNNKKAVVKYYVHPKLQHGAKLMVKGRVFVD